SDSQRLPLGRTSSSSSRTTAPPPGSSTGRSGLDQGRKRPRTEMGSPSTAHQQNTAPQPTRLSSGASARRLFSEVAKASKPPSNSTAQPTTPFRKVLGTATYTSPSYLRRSLRFPTLPEPVVYLHVPTPLWGDPSYLREVLKGMPTLIGADFLPSFQLIALFPPSLEAKAKWLSNSFRPSAKSTL